MDYTLVSVDTHVSPRLQRGSAHWGRNDLFFPGPFPALLALDESVHVTFCFCEKTHQNVTCQSRAVWPPLWGLGPWAVPRVHPEASPLASPAEGPTASHPCCRLAGPSGLEL